MSALSATSHASFAVATARPKIFFPPAVAVNAIVTDFWIKQGFTEKAGSPEHRNYELNLRRYEPAAFEYLQIEH